MRSSVSYGNNSGLQVYSHPQGLCSVAGLPTTQRFQQFHLHH
ncbi:MAG: hypothetical protein ACO31I_01665 [Prochlorotrichaceae cyanobacterium]